MLNNHSNVEQDLRGLDSGYQNDDVHGIGYEAGRDWDHLLCEHVRDCLRILFVVTMMAHFYHYALVRPQDVPEHLGSVRLLHRAVQ